MCVSMCATGQQPEWGAMWAHAGLHGGDAYRADLGGRTGARQGLQGPPQAAAIAPHTQVSQVLPAQALGTVRAARGTVIDLHWGRHRSSVGPLRTGPLAMVSHLRERPPPHKY